MTSSDRKSTQKTTEHPPTIASEWREAITNHVAEAAKVRLRWKTTNSARAWIPVCDDVPVVMSEVYGRGKDGRESRVYAVEHDGTQMSPEAFADRLWLDCYAVYLEEREARGGSLRSIVASVEVLDSHNNVLAESVKVQRPEVREDGDVQWFSEDAESAEERRDRGLMAEMRRDRIHFTSLLRQQSDAMVQMSRAMVGMHGTLMDEREQLHFERVELHREYAEEEASTRRGDQVLELLKVGLMSRGGGASSGVPDAPGSDDALISATRDFVEALDDSGWDALTSISETFRDVASAMSYALRYDAAREPLEARLRAVLVGLESEALDQDAVAAALPPGAIPALLRIRDELGLT